ncbi:hypothetical protein AFCA_007052 [Aspergillus flavus]|nr:hypothetical protein AFCA_007052 [Aspergillus flavus]
MASTLLTSAQDIFRKDDSFAGFKDIVAEFPPGSRLISARPLGISTWTNTTRLSVEHPDGKEKVYFLKCAQSEDGRVLVQGEFNSMSEIYATAPGFVPKPYTWGTCYLDDTEAYFFISEFIDFSSKLSKFDRICRKLADLHQTSVSPTGKFGFHVTTYVKVQLAYDDLYDLINQYAPFGEGAGPPPLALNERVELPRERDHTRSVLILAIIATLVYG